MPMKRSLPTHLRRGAYAPRFAWLEWPLAIAVVIAAVAWAVKGILWISENLMK